MSAEVESLEDWNVTSLYVPRLAKIEAIETETPLEKTFRVSQEDGSPLFHRPGQFVSVSVPGVGEAPISICSSPTEGATFALCIRQAGSLTGVLHGLIPGGWLGIRGPFGQGFPMKESRGKDLLFVAGGIGLAPLRSAICYALDRREDYGKVTILYGARAPEDILFCNDLDLWYARKDVTVLTTVDTPTEGWNGNVGVITTLFPKLDNVVAEQTVVMVVGPPVMYRFVLLELQGMDIPERQIVFSLERRMKCGVGKCGHCQINGTYVCQEGPVFSYPRLTKLWEAVERVAPVGA